MSPEDTSTAFLDRVAYFLLFGGVLLVAFGLGLDYARTRVQAAPGQGLPVAVYIIQKDPARWVYMQVSEAYFARQSLAWNPAHLIFWGMLTLLAGWLLRQRQQVMATEMEAEALARQRRIFRRWWRRGGGSG